MSPGARGQPKLTGLLVLLCLGLATVIYLELNDPPLSRAAQSMPSGGTTPATRAQPDMGIELPPLSVYSEIAGRPLFSPNRRPLPAGESASEPVVEGPTPGAEFLLRGVALAGESRIALVERRNTQELLRVLEGQSVGGWRLTAIRPDAVVLEGRGDEHVLEVEKDTSPPAATVERLMRRLQAQPADPEQLEADLEAQTDELDLEQDEPGPEQETDLEAFLEEEMVDPQDELAEELPAD